MEMAQKRLSVEDYSKTRLQDEITVGEYLRGLREGSRIIIAGREVANFPLHMCEKKHKTITNDFIELASTHHGGNMARGFAPILRTLRSVEMGEAIIADEDAPLSAASSRHSSRNSSRTNSRAHSRETTPQISMPPPKCIPPKRIGRDVSVPAKKARTDENEELEVDEDAASFSGSSGTSSRGRTRRPTMIPQATP
ncbi:hypothetical protein PENTCL1PPCAC_23029 [Pristionchus entomophagus]|uniref:Uncharacterized protein n=1 Tax=Pristionchus entomophagus TaxID=358040 RepID=A0AAV5U3P5_9BILA|nr:hypothetical protein PENTCL1PPCAC_23029 [Pristionchus entomophagus]